MRIESISAPVAAAIAGLTLASAWQCDAWLTLSLASAAIFVGFAPAFDDWSNAAARHSLTVIPIEDDTAMVPTSAERAQP